MRSYKIRGAYNFIAGLSRRRAGRRRGVRQCRQPRPGGGVELPPPRACAARCSCPSARRARRWPASGPWPATSSTCTSPARASTTPSPPRPPTRRRPAPPWCPPSTIPPPSPARAPSRSRWWSSSAAAPTSSSSRSAAAGSSRASPSSLDGLGARHRGGGGPARRGARHGALARGGAARHHRHRRRLRRRRRGAHARASSRSPSCATWCRRSMVVEEGRVCTEQLDLYQVDGIVAEPAGALAIAALDAIAADDRRARAWCAS